MQLKDFLLERYFAKYEFHTPYLLCSSDCETVSISELLSMEAGAEAAFLQLPLSYTESAGHPELRKRIADQYPKGKAEDILVYSGAEEGIFIAMNVLLSKGEEVVVQTPCYQSLFEVANGIGAIVKPWHMDPDHAWELDLNFLKDQLSAQTRMVVVNFPNNPTGYYPAPEFFDSLVQVCRAKNLYLFVDEVYRGLEYHGTAVLPSAYSQYEKAISLGVMSKSLGLPGLRIGWTATQDSVLTERLAAFKDYTTICNAGPSEFLSILALKNAQKLLDRNQNIVKHNLSLLDDFFSRNSSLLSWERPKAGAIGFPKWSQEPTTDFYQALAQAYGVLLLPGQYYGFSDQYFRLGFGRKNMPEALEVWEKSLRDA